MSTQNAKKPVRPGDTFIAYIEDGVCDVGVVVKDCDGKTDVLVLGHMDGLKDRNNVFAPVFEYPFPSYRTIKSEYVVPYTFKLEIALCKARDSVWWKSQGPPCYTNLIARHFRPTNVEELKYIHAAQHILRKGGIDDFKSFGRIYDESFLRLWVTLYGLFPEKTIKPPYEWDVKSSNVYYKIDVSDRQSPTVTCGFR